MKITSPLGEDVELSMDQREGLINELPKYKQSLILSEINSGKTFISLLNCVNKLYNLNPNYRSSTKGTLIVTPTKESAIQIYKTCKQIDGEGKLKITRLGSVSQMAIYSRKMVG